jgi:hypothetical protein
MRKWCLRHHSWKWPWIDCCYGAIYTVFMLYKGLPYSFVFGVHNSGLLLESSHTYHTMLHEFSYFAIQGSRITANISCSSSSDLCTTKDSTGLRLRNQNRNSAVDLLFSRWMHLPSTAPTTPPNQCIAWWADCCVWGISSKIYPSHDRHSSLVKSLLY